MTEIDLLEHSPFNFYHGINPKRLLKGRNTICRNNLIKNLSCVFCHNVVVQGKECADSEDNFCEPCYKKYQETDAYKYSNKYKNMKPLNKIKLEMLINVRFKCNNTGCKHELTYDELILGTHELDECMFMKIICENCGAKIPKWDKLRHDALDCSNPMADQKKKLD